MLAIRQVYGVKSINKVISDDITDTIDDCFIATMPVQNMRRTSFFQFFFRPANNYNLPNTSRFSKLDAEPPTVASSP
jgi:hypothetical protein